MQDETTAKLRPQPDATAQLHDLPALPPRPRLRLLAPLPLSLAALVLIGCGFLAGVLVEKGQLPTSGPAATSNFATAGAAGRLFAARGAGSGTGSPSASGLLSGEVSFVAGNTLYVVNREGRTVKVRSSAGTKITRSVSAPLSTIHPGEIVIASGLSGAGGTFIAETIRAGAAGESGGGLFGAGALGDAGAARTAGESQTSARGGEPALFGGGGG
jgi:hypothetical protein